MHHNASHRWVGWAAAIVLAAGPAVADTIFELDGDALNQGGIPPEDWETLYDDGSNTGGNSLAFTGIFPDPNGETVFRGGKKDIQDVSHWEWKSGAVPDKNEITNAYAAAYANNSDLILYFGADRFSNTGDAFLGFWFFQDRVALNPDGSFDGVHQIGDILVLVNYPQGANAMPEVQVLEWNPDLQDAGENLHLLYTGVGAVCGNVPPDPVCAITNAFDEPSPWPYAPKDGVAGIYPYESFFEGGINLTEIIGGTSCFSSFMAETRSSTSVTATLKDFVLGEFPVCGIEVTKTCEVVRLTDESDNTDRLFVVDFAGVVTNTGGGTFPTGSVITVIDDAGTSSDPADDVVIQETLGAPLGPGGMYPFMGSFFSDDNPPFNEVTASIDTGETITSADAFSTECEALQLNPDLSVSKMCWLELTTIDSKVVLLVAFWGDVMNTGDVPLIVTVDDDMAGPVLGPVLLLPGDSVGFSGSYLPTAANGGETDPSMAMFTDTVTAEGLSPALLEPVIAMQSATCPLCP